MRQPSSFSRFVLATTLSAAPALALPLPQPKTASAPPSTVIGNLTSLLRAWMPGLWLSPYARRAVVQTGVIPNLDTLRYNLPQAPAAYVQGSLPASTYNDPKPLNNALAATYLSHLTFPHKQGGPVGALPMQAGDQTTANSVIGGLSVNMLTKQS